MKKQPNIAAPIRNHQGKVIVAVSISGPAFKIDINTQNNLKKALIETSEKISKKLEYNSKL